jgi:hypothetical protein
MLYLYGDNIIFGIDLKLKFMGINTDKVLNKKLKKVRCFMMKLRYLLNINVFFD